MKNKDPWDELTTDAGPRYNNLTIDRSKWLRGGNIPVGVEPYHTCLLNEKGDMCPMGFHMCALGFPEEFIKNVGEPSELEFEELFDDGVLQSPGGQELRRGAGMPETTGAVEAPVGLEPSCSRLVALLSRDAIQTNTHK